ncbi:MAG TPA: DNA polymerase III subunit gamma/tau [Candidatus Deferrimicrobiaceae bacterium]
MYEALSRKWRPRTFDEIVGQGHVTRALANAISLGKIHHAYLFSGTRGVGKTTFARILSRALNCVNGPTATPCLVCPACLAVEQGSATDVQEIDGASNNGIDDVRQLRENAAYAPASMRYKIFIIDEVHMLSKQAFNALLKILEEPPPHVVFIFATTEPNKLPDTILSRVQRFDFRMLTEEEILDRFKLMAEKEKIDCEEDALRLLARYAFGSMRDGQSIFEQAAVSGNGKVTSALVEEILGLVGVEAAIDLVRSVVVEGAEGALGRFALLQSRGADLKFLYLSLVDVLRDAAVLAFTGQEALLSRHAPSSLAQMKSLVAERSREEWMFLLDIAFRSEKDVVATEFPRLGFELLLLRLVNAPSLLLAENMADGQPAAPPRTVRAVVAPSSAGLPPAPSGAPHPEAAHVSGTTTSSSGGHHAHAPAPAAPGARGPAGGKAGDLWEAVKRNLEGKKKVPLVALLSSLAGHRDGDALMIEGAEALLSMVRDPDKLALIEKAVEEVAGTRLTLRFGAEGEKKNVEPAELISDTKRLERMAFEDPAVRDFLREFDGNLIEVRPTPPKAPVPAIPVPPPGADAEEGAADETEDGGEDT